MISKSMRARAWKQRPTWRLSRLWRRESYYGQLVRAPPPLISRQVVANLIGNTTTQTGLRIQAVLGGNTHVAGIKVADEELAALAIERDEFHGEWNYRLQPRDKATRSNCSCCFFSIPYTT